MHDLQSLFELMKSHFENKDKLSEEDMHKEFDVCHDFIRCALNVHQCLYYNGHSILDVNAADPYGVTVLMKAARIGWMDMVKFLCENGAKIILSPEEIQELRARSVASAYPDGNALTAAVIGRHYEVVSYFTDMLEKEGKDGN